MNRVETLAGLAALYGDPPMGAAVIKVTNALTAPDRDWIAASRFCILTSVGPEGTDGSPRGNDGPVVRIGRAAATMW